ncbi:MAG: aminopeptidase P N-terminal domain-containing protein [Gemmatimonadota bacterium]
MTRHLLGFSPEAFVQRRTRVGQMLGKGALILPAAPVSHRSRDTQHRYRPDSELFYLTGCTDPGVVAVLRDTENESFILFVPRRDPRAEVWSGARMGPEEALERFGADAVFALEEMEEHLPGLLKPSRRIFFRLGVHPRLEAQVVSALRWARSRGTRTGEGPRAVEDPGELLDGLRLVKEPEEISRIRKATSLTVAAFRETLGATEPGMGEWQVEAILESAFRRGGASGPAFPTIVGSGENGCVLHYVDNKATIDGDGLVLLDGGAEVDLYAGDVTRTFPGGGRFSARQLEVYEVVLRAHQSAISRVGPGFTMAQVNDAALEELTKGLVGLGVLTGDVGDLMARKTYEPYFPHKISHWLGLDVHDAGDYASEKGSRLLEPGMVLTIEPGLYFPSGADTPSHPYRGIGVRIEDDLIVTEDGAENLTESLPVAPGELEALVGAGLRG